MSMDYVRRYCGVPARRGLRVRYANREGVITRATHYVWVRFDGERRSRPLHPCEPTLVYLTGEEAPHA